MTSKKPKGKIPSLISGSSGKPKKVLIERKSQCRRCKDDLETGKHCYEIPKVSSGFTSQKRFCQSCFQDILVQTQNDLEQLKTL